MRRRKAWRRAERKPVQAAVRADITAALSAKNSLARERPSAADFLVVAVGPAAGAEVPGLERGGQDWRARGQGVDEEWPRMRLPNTTC